MHRRRLDDRDDLPTSVLLRDYPFEMVRLACTRCGRRGQYRKSTLLARFGPNYCLVEHETRPCGGLPEDPGAEHSRALRRDLLGPDRTMKKPRQCGGASRAAAGAVYADAAKRASWAVSQGLASAFSPSRTRGKRKAAPQGGPACRAALLNAIGTCSRLADPCAGSPRYAAAAAACAADTAYAAEDAHAASATSASAACSASAASASGYRCAPASAPRNYPAPASASAPTAAASAPLGYPFIEPGSSHVFPVEDIECREADVGDFLLLESKQRSRCSRLRRSIGRRWSCSRCAAGHCQGHPRGPPNRQGFLATFSLRSLFRTRHSPPSLYMRANARRMRVSPQRGKRQR